MNAAFAEKDSFCLPLHDFISREILPFDIRDAIIDSPADFAAFNLATRSPYFESLKVAVLDSANQVVYSQIVHGGGLNKSIADARTVSGIIASAKRLNPKAKLSGWIIAHNHPSGDPSPSNADKIITHRLATMGSIIGLPMVDHVVTNGDRYFSFREAGLLNIPAMDASIDNLPKRSPRPRLPILPTPKRPDIGNTAEWEALPIGSFASVPFASGPASAAPYLRTLRTADPGHYHIIYLYTRMGMRAVERIPTDLTAAQMAQRIMQGAAREGAMNYLLSMPEAAADANQVNEATTNALTSGQRRIVRSVNDQLSQVNLHMADAMIAGPGTPIYYSFMERGLLEQSASYASDRSTAANQLRLFASARITDPPISTPEQKALEDSRIHAIDTLLHGQRRPIAQASPSYVARSSRAQLQALLSHLRRGQRTGGPPAGDEQARQAESRRLDKTLLTATELLLLKRLV